MNWISAHYFFQRMRENELASWTGEQTVYERLVEERPNAAAPGGGLIHVQPEMAAVRAGLIKLGTWEQAKDGDRTAGRGRRSRVHSRPPTGRAW